MVQLIALLAGPAHAMSSCPSGVTVQGELTCSSEISGEIDHTAESYLGGNCDDEACYTCGDPYANESQVAPEHVYTFECQLEGTVRMLITDLPCDLDIYVLDDTCDPYGGCLFGSTASYAVDDEVEFTCTPGKIYIIVVEAYGTKHLDLASGPCTDDGTATGTVYSPTYTLSFDVSASTGCAEDCDDGADNDLDDTIDCEDTDCWSESMCCDTDGDDAFAEDCGGDDCDDADGAVFPGATETCNGNDDDCDGTVDEETSCFDDDGDGWTEDGGDCDDADPDVNPGEDDVPDNGIDEDCSGADATTPEDTGPVDDTAAEDTGGSGGTDDDGDQDDDGEKDEKSCGCASAPRGLAGLAWLVLAAALVRRRR